MKTQITTIAIKEFSDRFRSGWIIGCIVVWLAAVCLTSFFGLIQIGKMGFQGYERTVISLLNLVQYLVPLLALLLAHDLIVGEREDRTLSYLIATGVSRGRLLLGKFFGAASALAFSLFLGFGVAGVAIGYQARDQNYASFVTLAVSTTLLGIVFLAAGLAISAYSRTRVQALVISLLTWGTAVFVFDLAALGILVKFASPAAQAEIEIACDPSHVNAEAMDIHAAFDVQSDAQEQAVRHPPSIKISWLWVNPVDLFRAVNLERQLKIPVSPLIVVVCVGGWMAVLIFASNRKFRSMDL